MDEIVDGTYRCLCSQEEGTLARLLFHVELCDAVTEEDRNLVYSFMDAIAEKNEPNGNREDIVCL